MKSRLNVGIAILLPFLLKSYQESDPLPNALISGIDNPSVAVVDAKTLELINTSQLSVTTSFVSQKSEPCSGSVKAEELMAIFALRNETSLLLELERTCFQFSQEVKDRYLTTVRVYQRIYEVDNGNTIYTFNEVIYVKEGRARGYRCVDLDQVDRILRSIKKETVFLHSYADGKRYMYIQKNKKNKFIFSSTCSSNKCDYDFTYEAVDDIDELIWTDQVAKDAFPGNEQERARLQYRYANISSTDTSSDIILQAGDKIMITASGEVRFGSFAGSGGPEGINGFQTYSKIQAFRHGSLLYRIGSDNWATVGKQITITAENSGILQLMVNDSDASNNVGDFRTFIKIITRS